MNTMSTKLSSGKSDFEFVMGTAADRARRDPAASFQLAVLGDFSGRGSRGVLEPISGRRMRSVDCDSFDETVTRLEVRLRLPGSPAPEQSLDLDFSNLDDFHPDRLLRRVPQLAALLGQRRQLLDPATAQAAADELRRLLSQRTVSTLENPVPAPTSEVDSDTLVRLLGDRPKPVAKPTPVREGIDISDFIQSLVGSSATAGATPQQTALLSALDLELSSRLRTILHQPQFQALEAVWRGADRLVREFGGEENVKIHLIDLSKEELVADLQAQEDQRQTGLCRLLHQAAEEQPWAALVGCYSFDAELTDLQMLGRIARISAWIGAPFLAAASPHLVGCDSFAAHPDPDDWKTLISNESQARWQALREMSEASYLGIALPRFLLRQPYGQDNDPIESFPFEELPVDLPHESYLWGNPAILCAHALADAFRAEGWAMQPSGYAEVGDLPVHRFKNEGESEVKPCAEAWLTERAGDAILAKGLIPVLSIKGRDAVRLANLQSLRSPDAPLAGRWG